MKIKIELTFQEFGSVLAALDVVKGIVAKNNDILGADDLSKLTQKIDAQAREQLEEQMAKDWKDNPNLSSEDEARLDRIGKKLLTPRQLAASLGLSPLRPIPKENE